MNLNCHFFMTYCMNKAKWKKPFLTSQGRKARKASGKRVSANMRNKVRRGAASFIFYMSGGEKPTPGTATGSSLSPSYHPGNEQEPTPDSGGPSTLDILLGSSSEPSALDRREEELIQENLEIRKGALADGEGISGVRKAVELDFNVNKSTNSN